MLAQAHANAGNATPHREHRREDRDRRASRRAAQEPNAVSSPTSAHVKTSRRNVTEPRSAARAADASMQPIAPTSRRASQQAARGDNSNTALHPYAAAPSSPYRNPPYVRPESGNAVNGTPPAAGSSGALNGATNANADSYRYGGTGIQPDMVRGNMAVYDRGIDRGAEGDDEHGVSRKKGFFGLFCCA